MELSDLFELKAAKIAESLFVIVIEDKRGQRRLIKDPGMDRPWYTKNRKLADSHAQEIERSGRVRKAGVMTLAEAFNTLQAQFAKEYQARN